MKFEEKKNNKKQGVRRPGKLLHFLPSKKKLRKEWKWSKRKCFVGSRYSPNGWDTFLSFYATVKKRSSCSGDEQNARPFAPIGVSCENPRTNRKRKHFMVKTLAKKVENNASVGAAKS